MRHFTLTALAVALAASPAGAQTAPGLRANPRAQTAPGVQAPAGAQAVPGAQNAVGGQNAARTTAVNDWLFAEAAADGGMAEVSLAELGMQKATDPELKRISQEMVDDHKKLNQELVNLAAQKRIGLPRGIDPRAQFCAQSLAGLSGDHFDKCYAKAQLHAHMEALGAFEAEAERGQDPDMKALASRAVPRIKHHLEAIKKIAHKHEKANDKDKDNDHKDRSER